VNDNGYERGMALLQGHVPDARRRTGRVIEGETDLGHYAIGHIYGDLCQRPQLSMRDREFAVLAALATLGVCEETLTQHIVLARASGVTREEIFELFLHLSAYAGFPRAIEATNVATHVLTADEKQV
jgi:4-carboxymuconolactone decarboxylase